jgi:ferredoxin
MKAFPLRFFMAGLTRLPLLGNVVDRLYFENDDIIYVPMDRVIEINKKIDSPEQTVLPSKVVEYFIENSSHHFIMNECICRASAGCKDYPVGLGCLFLGEASKNISLKLGRRATKEEAFEHLKKCREKGLVHLIGRNKLDAVWLKAGPDNKLLTICNCCPCCCLWKMLPELSEDISSKVKKMPGVSIQVTDRCIGCGKCTEACFVAAINIIDGKAVIGGQCRGCGRCATICPKKAIEVNIDATSLENSIKNISASVEV